MIGQGRKRHRGTAVRTVLCAGAIVLTMAYFACAQEPQAQPDNAPAPTAPPAFEPGFLHALSRWFDDSMGHIGLKSPGEVAKEATDRAKEAAETMVRLPTTRIIAGRQKCEPAANGAPDCQAAANVVCRSKGFTSGQSVDIESAQKCPAHVWLARRSPDPGECAMETFVTRAICQ